MTRMTRRRRIALAPFVTLALAPSALTQSAHPPQETFSLQGPEFHTGEAFGRSSAGDFNQDSFPDVAALKGGEVIVCGAPGGVRWWKTTSIAASDLTTLKTPGASDQFVTVGSAGVYAHAFDAQNEGALVSTQLTTSSTWAGALRVDARGDTIVGLGSNARTIEVLTRSGSSWSSSTLLTAGADVVDLELTDLDDDQALEVTVVTADTLSSYALATGTLVDPTPYTYTAASSTTLSTGRQSSGEEWAAWTMRRNGNDWLVVIDGQGIASLLNLGNRMVSGAATVYWAGAERQDLALSFKEQDVLWVLHNSGGTRPSFSTGNDTEIALAQGTAPSSAQPVALDVDLDGDGDLVLGVQPSEEFGVLRNGRIDHLDDLVLVVPLEDYGDMMAIPWGSCGTVVAPNTNDEYTLRIEFQRPSGAPGANAIGYAVWEQMDNGGTGGPSTWTTDPVAAAPQLIQAFTTSSLELDVAIPNPDNIGCEQAGVISTNIYYVELQLLEVDTGGNVTTVFGSKLIGVETAGFNSANGSYLLSIGNSETESTIFYSPYSDPNEIGTGIEMSDLPNLAPGAIVK